MAGVAFGVQAVKIAFFFTTFSTSGVLYFGADDGSIYQLMMMNDRASSLAQQQNTMPL